MFNTAPKLPSSRISLRRDKNGFSIAKSTDFQGSLDMEFEAPIPSPTPREIVSRINRRFANALNAPLDVDPIVEEAGVTWESPA